MASCTPEVLSNLTSSDTFFTWLNGQHEIADPLMLSSYSLTPDDTDTLLSVQTSLQDHNDCLTEIVGGLSDINTENSDKRTKITEAITTLKERQLDVQISQDRALLVRHPEMSRSYYEGIIPIGRPISHYSIPILIGVATFLLSMSIFMFMSIIKVDSRLLIPRPIQSISVSTSYGTPFVLMSGVAAILLALTIYAFNKK